MATQHALLSKDPKNVILFNNAAANADRSAERGLRRTARPRVGASAGFACVGTWLQIREQQVWRNLPKMTLEPS